VENVQWEAAYGDVTPSLVGLESLRVLKLACRHARLTDSQVEAIFHDNAVRLSVAIHSNQDNTR
jgi:cystathionine beta-lyase/cystathionine gamma-synthase